MPAEEQVWKKVVRWWKLDEDFTFPDARSRRYFHKPLDSDSGTYENNWEWQHRFWACVHKGGRSQEKLDEMQEVFTTWEKKIQRIVKGH